MKLAAIATIAALALPVHAIQEDKQHHMVAGLAIASVCTVIKHKVEKVEQWHCAALVVSAAVGKELYDATGRGTPEVNDALYTIAGGVPLLTIRWDF